MTKITDPAVVALAAADETPYESFTEGQVYMQRACPECDKGLIYSPVRFCGPCGGSGYLVRTVTPPAEVPA